MGRITNLLMGSRWDEIIISEIKRRFLKRDADLLKVKAETLLN
jgi:hypothetical protein